MTIDLISLLKSSYHDATRKGGLGEFTAKIRTAQNDNSGKYSVTLNELKNLFSASVWEEVKTKSGHRVLKNRVTHVVINYANHDSKGGVDPGVAESLFDKIQEHLNILCNEIFHYKTNNWKSEPDYEAAAGRLKKRVEKNQKS